MHPKVPASFVSYSIWKSVFCKLFTAGAEGVSAIEAFMVQKTIANIVHERKINFLLKASG
jgi:hypothetical protein